MKKLTKLFCITAIGFSFLAAPFTPLSATVTDSVSAQAEGSTARYDSADEVVYSTANVSGKTCVANWGDRDEECLFLSKYAQAFYTGDYKYETLSTQSGNAKQTQAHTSELYKSLQTLMTSKHTFYTYYDGNKNVRSYYKYTDCIKNDVSKVSLLYLGTLQTSEWNQGNIWNQEHMWPQSKLPGSKEIGDIMHLRPSNPSENSSRGNTAYGKSSGYYNPDQNGENIKGDCARTMLYMYVRWGLNSTMWGSNGVIESRDVLLQWMEEDPVDTWEMGRNDAVQSVTGTRNVFVDYPEYAWLLFDQEIPTDMPTPSGIATSLKDDNTGDSSGDTSVDSGSEDVSQNTSSTDSGSEDNSLQDTSSGSNGLTDYPFAVDMSSCSASISISGVGSLLLAGSILCLLKKKKQ